MTSILESLELPNPLKPDRVKKFHSEVPESVRLKYIRKIIGCIYPNLCEKDQNEQFDKLCENAAKMEKAIFETARMKLDYIDEICSEIDFLESRVRLIKFQHRNPLNELVAEVRNRAVILGDLAEESDAAYEIESRENILKQVELWQEQINLIRVEAKMPSPLQPEIVQDWHKNVSEDHRYSIIKMIMRALYHDYDANVDNAYLKNAYIFAATHECLAFSHGASFTYYNAIARDYVNKLTRTLAENGNKMEFKDLKVAVPISRFYLLENAPINAFAHLFDEDEINYEGTEPDMGRMVLNADDNNQNQVNEEETKCLGPADAEIWKQYHAVTTKNHRLDLIMRFVKTIYPDYESVQDDRLKDLFCYAAEKEVVIFEKASKRSEYDALMEAEFEKLATQMRVNKIYIIGLDKVKDFINILRQQSSEWNRTDNQEPIDFSGVDTGVVIGNTSGKLDTTIAAVSQDKDSDEVFDLLQEVEVCQGPLATKCWKDWHKTGACELRKNWLTSLKTALEYKLRDSQSEEYTRATITNAYTDEKNTFDQSNDQDEYIRRMTHIIAKAESSQDPVPETQWRTLVTRDIRSYFVRRLVAAQFDDFDSKPKNREIYELYRYAKASVDFDLEKATSLKDFYQRIATKILRIEKKLAKNNTDRNVLDKIEEFYVMMNRGTLDVIENVYEQIESQTDFVEKTDSEEDYHNVTTKSSKLYIMDGGIASIIMHNFYENVMGVDEKIIEVLKPLAPESNRVQSWHMTVSKKVRVYVIRRLMKEWFSGITTLEEYRTYGGFVDVAVGREKSIYEVAMTKDQYYRMIGCILYGWEETRVQGHMNSYLASISETNELDIADFASRLVAQSPIQLPQNNNRDDDDYEHILQEKCELTSIGDLAVLFRYAFFEKNVKATETAVANLWHVEISNYSRMKTIQRIVSVFFSNPEFNSFLDSDAKIQAIFDYAKRIEVEAYEKSASVSNYVLAVRSHNLQVFIAMKAMKKHFNYYEAFTLFTGRRENPIEAIRNSCLNKVLNEFQIPDKYSPFDDERVLKVWVELARFEKFVWKSTSRGMGFEDDVSQYLFMMARIINHIRDQFQTFHGLSNDFGWTDFEPVAVSVLRVLHENKYWMDPFMHFPWRRTETAPIVKENLVSLLSPVLYKMYGFLQTRLFSAENIFTPSGEPMNFGLIEAKLKGPIDQSFQNVEEFCLYMWKMLYNSSRNTDIIDNNYTTTFQLFWWFIDEMKPIMEKMGYSYSSQFNYDNFLINVLEHPAIATMAADFKQDYNRFKNEFQDKETQQ